MWELIKSFIAGKKVITFSTQGTGVIFRGQWREGRLQRGGLERVPAGPSLRSAAGGHCSVCGGVFPDV